MSAGRSRRTRRLRPRSAGWSGYRVPPITFKLLKKEKSFDVVVTAVQFRIVQGKDLLQVRTKVYKYGSVGL